MERVPCRGAWHHPRNQSNPHSDRRAGLWNQIDRLAELELPENDRHLIVTVHFYEPFAFTHQGAGWTDRKDKLGFDWTGSPEEIAALNRAFDKADAWSKANKRPLLLGEFGAYDKGPMDSRARWTAAVARSAEARGLELGLLAIRQ